VGFATGRRSLPCQVYEREVFFYSPSSLKIRGGRPIEAAEIENISPEYKLKYLEDRILAGATFVVFVNRVIEDVRGQNLVYRWIPYMPEIQMTRDRSVAGNRFLEYPDSDYRFLAPIVDVTSLDIPVLQKLVTPEPNPYRRDIFTLFGNGNREKLGVLITRGRGSLVVLPRFKSNEEAIMTFVQRIVPKIYESKSRVGLVDNYRSPSEKVAEMEVTAGEVELAQLEKELENRRVTLEAARREKQNVILQDATAKQILSYYDTALQQEGVALFYLYKAVELIENNHGGESGAIKKFGMGAEWKFLKKVANVSYADIRHAPKPGDVIKEWTDEDIKACFAACEKIVLAYFGSLFP